MIALAWRNLWRNPRRTLLTLGAIAFACLVMVFLFSLQVGTYATMEDNTMGLFDGYAQVQRPAYLDDPGIRKSFVGAALAEQVAGVPGIDAVAQRARTFALFSRDQHSMAAMVVGVQPAVEPRVSRIPRLLKAGHWLSGDEAAEVVLGQALARNLGVQPGDGVTLLGMGRDGSVAADVLTVAGVFASGVGELDRLLAELPLGRFQADFAMPDQANALVLSGASLDAVSRALPAVREKVAARGLAVRGWGDLEPGLRDAIRLDATTSLLWYVVLVVVSVAILLNTLLMSVLERTREFGLLLALGMSPATAGLMVWLEILMLVGLGLAAGIGLGAAAAGWYAVHGLVLPGAEGLFAQWGLPGRLYPRISFMSLFAAPAAIGLLASLSGLFPLLRLHRLEPVEAMRAV